MTQAQTMNHDHPRWLEFLERLEGPEGCDFQGEDEKSTTWKCKGGNDKSKATHILTEMGEINIEASLAFFQENGGHCDCEIIFNVDRRA